MPHRPPETDHPPRRGRGRRRGALAPLLVLSALAPVSAGQAQERAPAFAIENVTVVPMVGERVLPSHTVVVRDGRIVEVSPSDAAQVPADAVRIDGAGRFLVPGLAEMHALLPAEDDPLRVVTLEESLILYLANGVTTIRGMAGAPYQLALRDQLARGDVLGPTLYPGSPPFEAATTPAGVEERVRAHREAGYLLLPVESDLSAEAWASLVAAAGDGVPFGGRVPTAVGIRRALEDGISSVDGLDGYLAATRRDGVASDAPLAERLRATDPGKLEELARATAEAGVFVVPAQYLSNHLHAWNHMFGRLVQADTVRTLPEYQYVPQARRDQWSTDAWNLWSSPETTAESAAAHAAWRRDLLAALHAAGVDVLVGTISPALLNVPGFAVHRELPLMVEAGMTPYEVLEAATSTAARYVGEVLGEEGDFGTVEVGKRADLVLLDSDPLAGVEALRSPAGVMVHGTWLPREILQERLERIATRHKDYDTD